MAPESSAVVKADSESPYRLDGSQIHKASSSLLKYIASTAADNASKSATKNLLASNESNAETEPIWLVLTTKKHIITQPRLKPGKIHLPHSLNQSPSLSICLIVPEPQRQFKDAIAHPSFPPELSKRITRVIDFKKMEKKYHSYESRAQLRDTHDLFLADDRIITYLPKILGKTFLATTSKRPIPVRLAATKHKSAKANAALPSTKAKKEHSELKSVTTPELMAKEIERTLSMVLVNLSPSVTTSVKIGLASFKTNQVKENLEAVVAGMIVKYVPRKWRGVKAIHIKGPNTMALPIWLADELWDDEAMVLEDQEAEAFREKALQKGKRKRKLVEAGEEGVQEDSGLDKNRILDEKDNTQLEKKSKLKDEGMSREMKDRREQLRLQKTKIREEQAEDKGVDNVEKKQRKKKKSEEFDAI